MQVGNARYLNADDVPKTLPVFPLSGALLLPAGQLPLNIFEPRYLAMFDKAMTTHRLIGLIQPSLSEGDARQQAPGTRPPLCNVGCIGRITSFSESGDGRYVVSLSGVCRFRVKEETTGHEPYRSFKVVPFVSDFSCYEEEKSVDRQALLTAFRTYLDANKLEADWESVERASNLTLVNSLSMMSPFEPAEKQALLEAPDLKTRAETLIAITEIVVARHFGVNDNLLQ